MLDLKEVAGRQVLLSSDAVVLKPTPLAPAAAPSPCLGCVETLICAFTIGHVTKRVLYRGSSGDAAANDVSAI